MWGLSRYYGITSPNLTKALWFQNVLYIVILKEKKKLINFWNKFSFLPISHSVLLTKKTVPSVSSWMGLLMSYMLHQQNIPGFLWWNQWIVPMHKSLCEDWMWGKSMLSELARDPNTILSLGSTRSQCAGRSRLLEFKRNSSYTAELRF